MMHGRINVSDNDAYAGMFLSDIIHKWVPGAIGVLIGLKLLPYLLAFLEMIIYAIF